MIRQVNLDITHRCTLQCPRCQRVFYNGKPPGRDMTFDEFEKVLFYYPSVVLCGQRGDPIFHPQLPKFLHQAHEQSVSIEVFTAATGKPLEWYIQCFEANKHATWYFGIDGVPEDSHLYRINQNGEKLFEAMVLARELGLNVVWNYLVFKYNEDDVEYCRQLAAHHDIKFEKIISSRWIENDPYKPTADFIERTL